MVYNWEEYHDVCYRLYIDEKKPLEEIMQIMRSEHAFTPRCPISIHPSGLPSPEPKWVLSLAGPSPLTHIYPTDLPTLSTANVPIRFNSVAGTSPPNRTRLTKMTASSRGFRSYGPRICRRRTCCVS